jgi:hypothetical protein
MANFWANIYPPNHFDADLIYEDGENRLYLGSMDAVQDFDKLQSRNIVKVISVLDMLQPKFADRLHYLWIRCEDSYDWNLLSAMPQAIQHIEDVIVHKKHGPQASVIVHWYLKLHTHTIAYTIQRISVLTTCGFLSFSLPFTVLPVYHALLRWF